MRWLIVERDPCRMGLAMGMEMECNERKGCCRPLLRWVGWRRTMNTRRILMHTQMLKVLVLDLGGMEVRLEVVLMRTGIDEDDLLDRGSRMRGDIEGRRMKGMRMTIDL